MTGLLDALEERGELPAACATVAFWRDLADAIVAKANTHVVSPRRARRTRRTATAGPGQRQRRLTRSFSRGAEKKGR